MHGAGGVHGLNEPRGNDLAVQSKGKTFLTRTKQIFGKSIGNIPEGQKGKFNTGLWKLRIGVALVISGAVVAVAGVVTGVALMGSYGAGLPILLGGITLGSFMITSGIYLATRGAHQMKVAEQGGRPRPEIPQQARNINQINQPIPQQAQPQGQALQQPGPAMQHQGLAGHPGRPQGPLPPAPNQAQNRGAPPPHAPPKPPQMQQPAQNQNQAGQGNQNIIEQPRNVSIKTPNDIRNEFHNRFGNVMVTDGHPPPINAEAMIDELYGPHADLAKECLLNQAEPDLSWMKTGLYDRCLKSVAEGGDQSIHENPLAYFLADQILVPNSPNLQERVSRARQAEADHPTYSKVRPHPVRQKGITEEAMKDFDRQLADMNIYDAGAQKGMIDIINTHPQGAAINANINTLFGADAPLARRYFNELITGNKPALPRQIQLLQIEVDQMANNPTINGIRDMFPTKGDVSDDLYNVWKAKHDALPPQQLPRGGVPRGRNPPRV